MYPTTPGPSISQRSRIWLLVAYAPMLDMMTISGARIENGTRLIAANAGTSVSTRMTPMTLATYIDPISPQTKSRLVANSSGPGFKPQMKNPASITAAVGDPGMPSVNIGRSAPMPAGGAAGPGA